MSCRAEPARKKPSEQRKRKLTLHCRALPAEAEQIKKLADDLGMSVSEVLRQGALEAKIRRPRKQLPSLDRQALARLTGQLGKVGSNLNQLARLANLNGGIGVENELGDVVADCRALMNRLAKVLA